jgi:hypothetical protein
VGHDELRARVLASVADDIDRGVLAMGDVDRLLERMVAPLADAAPRNPIATVR